MQCRCRLLALAIALLVSPCVWAQSQPGPRINTIAPMGGQVGASLDLSVTGINLEDAEGLHFSFAGVKAEPVSKQIVKEKPGKGMKGNKGGVQSTVKFKVVLPDKAPLGIHDVRIVTKVGVSNPRAFVVGDLPEINEVEPNNDVSKPQQVALNTTVNGLIPTGTDVDYYAFTGKKGQRILASCLSTSIDSKVPLFLQLYNTAGDYLGFSKNYHDEDALLDATLPADGEYFVRVCSFTYTQGGPEYFYRLTIGTMPWIDAVFPPVVEPGKASKVMLIGRNLPQGKLDAKLVDAGKILETETVTIQAPADAHHTLQWFGHVSPPAAALSGFSYQVKNNVGHSNSVLMQLARAPVVIENDDNDTSDKAQRVDVPCEIAGLVNKKGDRDWYVFTAKKGQVFNIEALGDRLGSPVDLFFSLHADKNRITEQDDNPEIGSNQFYTRSDDPTPYRFAVPADGEYKIQIASRYAFVSSGPRHVYMLRITPEEPDFQVVAMPPAPLTPEAVLLGKGSQQAFTLFVLRQGNFNGDITVSGDNLPPGITVIPQIISGTQKQAALVVSASDQAKNYVGPLKILASAVVDGKKVMRQVRSATLTWPIAQANTPTVARLDRELVVSLQEPAPYVLSVDKNKITVPEGEKITIPVKVKRAAADFKDTVTIVALNVPPNMTVQKPLALSPGKDAGEIVIAGKGGGSAPAGNFTIVLQGQTQAPQAKQNQKTPQGVNLVQAAPPIHLTFIPKALARVNIEPKTVKLKSNGDTIIKVKIERLANYQGPFKLDVVQAKGVDVKAGTIAANQQEGQLTLRAAGAAPGSNVTLVVRVVGMFNDQPVIQETKLTINVSK